LPFRFVEEHAVLVVGWKLEKKGKKRTCFDIINSWGESWGNKGHVWYCLEKPEEMEFNKFVRK
jgi:C1A family cysteine protease